MKYLVRRCGSRANIDKRTTNNIMKIQKLIKILRVKGIKRRKPIVSVKNPGKINKNAAIAIDAPEIIS